MDITPLVPKGRQLVQAYGDGGFRISGTRYEGSVLILPDLTTAWDLRDFSELVPHTVQGLIDEAARYAGLLLVGTGSRMLPAPKALRILCQTAGIALEVMDTGAACRTYNVLLTEERSVAAALIAV